MAGVDPNNYDISFKCLSEEHNNQIPDLSIKPATLEFPVGVQPIELFIAN